MYINQKKNYFQTGRVVVAENSADCDGTFPNAHDGNAKTVDSLKPFFADLGLSDDEILKRIVALLGGGHSLGMCVL